ncbi:MAG: adenylate/guanylate cyclase domain-containing protein [Proteobacteria bacterium]|nr:MAG: adenylate/guanylate cyclase domain-containing protein [Pseudomonadota bacterium]
MRFFLFIISLFIFSPLALQAEPTVNDGLLDLRTWNPATDEAIEVKGQVPFYWKSFLISGPSSGERIFQDFPGSWNKDTKFPAIGFGSYRLRILLPNLQALSLRSGIISSSARYYINGSLIWQDGEPGQNFESTRGGMTKSWIHTFKPETTELILVIEVANYDMLAGGAYGELRIGNQEKILKIHEEASSKGLLLIGAMLIMSFYHILLYLLRREDSSTLWYGMFCGLMAGHLTIADPSAPWQLFYELDYSSRVRLFNITWVLALPCFFAFAFKLFPSKRWIPTALWVISFSIALIVTQTQPHDFMTTLSIFSVFASFFLVYLTVHAIRCYREKMQGAAPFLIALVCLFAAAMNDMLAMRGYIQSTPLLTKGVFLFTIGQSFLIAARFSKAFHRAETSEGEVKELNLSLERKVEEQTRDIRDMVSSLRGQRDKMERLNEYISDNVLERFFPHDLVSDLKAGRPIFNVKPQRKEVGVLFADLCGFTAQTESLDPTRLALLLNEFFKTLTQIAMDEGGTVDKFLGDGMLVLFELRHPHSPTGAIHAASTCALRMQAAMVGLNLIWQEQFGLNFSLRIGLHYGEAFVGCFGGDRRAEYTAIGTTVSIASRVESVAVPGQIFATESFRGACVEGLWEFAGEFKLKGITKAMRLFQLWDMKR